MLPTKVIGCLAQDFQPRCPNNTANTSTREDISIILDPGDIEVMISNVQHAQTQRHADRNPLLALHVQVPQRDPGEEGQDEIQHGGPRYLPVSASISVSFVGEWPLAYRT